MASKKLIAETATKLDRLAKHLKQVSLFALVVSVLAFAINPSIYTIASAAALIAINLVVIKGINTRSAYAYHILKELSFAAPITVVLLIFLFLGSVIDISIPTVSYEGSAYEIFTSIVLSFTKYPYLIAAYLYTKTIPVIVEGGAWALLVKSERPGDSTPPVHS